MVDFFLIITGIPELWYILSTASSAISLMGTILLIELHNHSSTNIPITVPMAAKTVRNENWIFVVTFDTRYLSKHHLVYTYFRLRRVLNIPMKKISTSCSGFKTIFDWSNAAPPPPKSPPRYFLSRYFTTPRF